MSHIPKPSLFDVMKVQRFARHSFTPLGPAIASRLGRGVRLSGAVLAMVVMAGNVTAQAESTVPAIAAETTAETKPGTAVRAAAGGQASVSEDLFLPPPSLDELTEITETAIAPTSQRKTKRHLVIRLEQRRVYLYEDDNLMVSYPVAIGKGGWETPKGEWTVDQMLKEPSWQHPWTGEIVPPGPDNPLGRRWIGFWTDGVNAIGFHGTPNENLVGQAVSHGCVRMKNAHIAALYQQIAMGATVRVE